MKGIQTSLDRVTPSHILPVFGCKILAGETQPCFVRIPHKPNTVSVMPGRA